MMATSIMRANENAEDIANVGTIPQFEWQVFLQGNVLANMMDEKVLSQHDGTSASRIWLFHADKIKFHCGAVWSSG